MALLILSGDTEILLLQQHLTCCSSSHVCTYQVHGAKTPAFSLFRHVKLGNVHQEMYTR